MGFYSDIQPNEYMMGRIGFRKVHMGFSFYLLFLIFDISINKFCPHHEYTWYLYNNNNNKLSNIFEIKENVEKDKVVNIPE